MNYHSLSLAIVFFILTANTSLTIPLFYGPFNLVKYKYLKTSLNQIPLENNEIQGHSKSTPTPLPLNRRKGFQIRRHSVREGKTMASNRFACFIGLALLLLMTLSSCQAYQLFRESPTAPIQPIRYHLFNIPDRYTDRMKQYHNTVTQLRLWRRYLDEDNDDEGSSQEIRR